MRIARADSYVVKLPPRRVHNWATKMQAPIGHHCIVRLRTDEGIDGWGEAPAVATWGGPHGMYFGETASTVRHVVHDYLVPALEDQDVLDIGRCHLLMDRAIKGHPYAKAAVDMALYDIAGKALGVPAYRLLGGAFRDRLPVCHSLGIMDNEAAIAEGEQAAAEGVPMIKCKAGLDPDRDIALVRDLRRRVGDRVQIRVDANEGWPSSREAVRIVRAMEAYGIALVEQPVAGFDELADVARAVSVPVMADESAWTGQDILRLAALGAAQVFSLYVTKPGGLYRAAQVAAVAQAVGMTCDIGGSIEMGVGNAANLHLAAAVEIARWPSVCPVTKPAGAAGPSMAGIYYLDDIVTRAFRYEDGHVLVPQGPGLGVEVDEEKLRRYAA